MCCDKSSEARGGHCIYGESHMLLTITAADTICLACS